MKRVLVLIVFIVMPVNMVYAGCSDLAAVFSTNSDSMDVDDLASLKQCVTSKLREKFDSSSSEPTPAYAPMPSLAPAPMPEPPMMPAPSR